MPYYPGQLVPGNIDLLHRPQVQNPDGTVSTVRSLGTEVDGKEVLLPTVSDDGKILSDRDTIQKYRSTPPWLQQHLGVFDSPEASTDYAKQLHEDQEQLVKQSKINALKKFIGQ